jgi:ArsR family transcriptional regulator, arsenate/arsenite/antimonite-responsive transcriptional repressor
LANIKSFRSFAKQRNEVMQEKVEFTEESVRIARIAKALSHPARVHILRKLSGMNSCCYSGDLVEELPIGRSTLSQHLKELKYAGLIQGEINPPYIKYCINRVNWEEAKILLKGLFNDEKDKMPPSGRNLKSVNV